MRNADRLRLPRPLHPGAWWLWALGLAAAASRTTNPLVLILVLVVAGYVVTARRSSAPWGGAFASFVRFGAIVIAIRVVFQMIFGSSAASGPVLFTLPDLAPGWAPGLRIGGPVTLNALTAAIQDGLRLATVLACIGAANALANPRRLLRSVPGALYELGVAVVVAMTFAPQLITDAHAARAARRLRGQRDRGLRALRRTVLPVLEGALERSLELAAAMDSRGYGRTGTATAASRRLTGVLLLVGLLGIAVGGYGLLDAGSPDLLGLPSLAVGVAAALAGLAVGGRRTARSRYRPDPWGLPEWLVAVAGAGTTATFLATGALDPGALSGPDALTATPQLPLLAVAGALLALTAAWTSPPPEPATVAVSEAGPVPEASS